VAAPLLETTGISKRYYNVQALREVNFAIYPGEVVGLMGENGAGKSTLLNILSGVIQPDTGRIQVGGKQVRLHSYREANLHGLARVFQEPALVPSLTVYENLYLGHEELFGPGPLIRHRKMAAQARQHLSVLDIHVDPHTLVGDLDVAARQLIEIAKAVSLGPMLGQQHPVVLLDEPTSSLERHSVNALFDLIRRQKEKASFVFVSHRLSETLALCDRIYLLKDGAVVDVARKGELDEKRLHEKLVGRPRDAHYYKENLQREHVGPLLLKTRELSVSGVLHGTALEVFAGEILGIGGVLGSGKAELGRVLAGDLAPTAGDIAVRGHSVTPWNVGTATSAGVGYLPEDRENEGIIGVLPVAWNISLPNMDQLLQGGLLNLKQEQAMADQSIRHLRIKTPDAQTQARNLSGGNQQKVVLSKWITRGSDILVLDNPTRGLDAGAKEEVYELLRGVVMQGDRAVVLITDDLLELISLSRRILIMRDRRIVREVPSPASAKPSEEQLVSYMV
jgi:ribose transport system ATP-binding protein